MIRARFVAAFIAPSLAVAGLAVADDPAHAVTTVSVSVNKNKITVGYSECKKYTVTATGDWASDANGNIIAVYINDQGGHFYDFDTTVDDRSGAVTFPFRVCGDDSKTGRFEAVVEVSGYGGPPTYTSTFVQGSDTFKVKVKPRKKSNLSIQKKRISRGAYKWKVVGTLTKAGSPYADRPVKAEIQIQGDWYTLRSNRTDKRGKFSFIFKPNTGLWRYRFAGDNKSKPSTSPAFRTGQPGRVVADRVDLRTLRELVLGP